MENNIGEMIIKDRCYGIDLLRMILMYMVCILHVLGQGGILENSVGGGYQAFWFLEIIAYCAVDTFAIISGYMATNKSQNYTKLISMWFQVFFYSFICTVILKLFYIRELPSIKELIKAFFPFTFNQFWYFSAYVGAFLVIPFLNNYLFNLDKLKANKILIGCIFCFVV